MEHNDINLLMDNLKRMVVGDYYTMPHSISLTARMAIERIESLEKQLFAVQEENRLLKERNTK